jgi:hypothetical protein
VKTSNQRCNSSRFEFGGTTFGTTAFCVGQLLALASEERSRAGGFITQGARRGRLFCFVYHSYIAEFLVCTVPAFTLTNSVTVKTEAVRFSDMSEHLNTMRCTNPTPLHHHPPPPHMLPKDNSEFSWHLPKCIVSRNVTPTKYQTKSRPSYENNLLTPDTHIHHIQHTNCSWHFISHSVNLDRSTTHKRKLPFTHWPPPHFLFGVKVSKIRYSTKIQIGRMRPI